MGRTRLVAVGACSIDTILTVPHFPPEDSKLRATSFTRRRGGNTSNTLEVLVQLLQLQGRSDVELNLVAPLPSRDSKETAFIQNSFVYSQEVNGPNRGLLGSTHDDNTENGLPSQQVKHEDELSSGQIKQEPSNSPPRPPPEAAFPSWISFPSVNLDYCLYREDFNEPVSSYVISSTATSSRTIINHNALPEMTFDEFKSIAEEIISSAPHGSNDYSNVEDCFWFHFEGRIPDVTMRCIRYLRYHRNLASGSGPQANLKISVELEKPGREGLQELALLADVVFYSRSWAEGEGYTSPEMCLSEQARIICHGGLTPDTRRAGDCVLICTWGSAGARAATIEGWRISLVMAEQVLDFVQSPAYISIDQPIVDTTGAGDTFIAGALFGKLCKGKFGYASEVWSLKQTLDFANGLAGLKILQQGFRVDERIFGDR